MKKYHYVWLSWSMAHDGYFARVCAYNVIPPRMYVPISEASRQRIVRLVRDHYPKCDISDQLICEVVIAPRASR